MYHYRKTKNQWGEGYHVLTITPETTPMWTAHFDGEAITLEEADRFIENFVKEHPDATSRPIYSWEGVGTAPGAESGIYDDVGKAARNTRGRRRMRY